MATIPASRGETGPTIALVVAAGRGGRVGGAVPKQFMLLGGVPVLRRTIAGLRDQPSIDRVVVVIAQADIAFYGQSIVGWENDPRLLAPVIGGTTRQASVLSGLEAVAALQPRVVVVHDGARPLATSGLHARVIAAIGDAEGAIAAMPVTETLKRASAGAIAATVDRAALVTAQTPQAFDFAALLAAHRRAAAEGRVDFTDDAALIEWTGGRVLLAPGEPDNIKLTTAADFARAELLLGDRIAGRTVTGIGYDVHAFTAGDHIMLGAVRIPHTHGVSAHSDGDVALHALTDALLGAIGDGDIGVHFPPSDQRWRGVASQRFLAHAAERVRARGGAIVHLDVTLLAEAPRIGPFREAMRAAIAAAAGITPAQVSLKATTSEGLGAIGRREGLAAFAVATVTIRDV